MIAAALIDTHCHFDFAPFCGDEAASLRRARAAGICDIIVPSIDASRFAPVLALAHRYPMLHVALGLHPLYIEHHRDTDIAALDTLLAQADPAVVALGEIGLDHYGDVRQPARQLSLLQDQLTLAQRYDLPVILHSRRSHDLLARTLRQRRLTRTGVVHGFAGSLAQAQAFVRLGYAIGVGGTITYARASKTRAAVAALPLEALLLETDAPDMPLSGYQGAPNRPEQLTRVFAALCALRSETPAQIAQALYDNTHRLFHFPPRA
ncbi:TatD family hydrolase [Edwardsiella anguillarum]|nr:TatD family hydrolase [Edwardsiella anguillarum]WHP80752.1 TatD family hydrolase [Edwardsiella anguillarum]WHQ18253.1 TatD family hydrolase [Edwardsiella anguillarum]WHQ21791.1 TatD family hydrolase [Edwardsiella anguillarum]WHQ25314.1 TatD family hydrolase [Edwardsiella anguillarum]WHQ28839.1 TatD family hydrolase [Edwardsiella anguillarum]